MKKALLLVFGLISASLAFAQPCTPDPNLKTPGISPNKLPDGIVGEPYVQIVSLLVPSDTNLIYNGTPINAKVDSARVIYISQMPHNFSYVTDRPNSTWNGGQKGCAKLFGTPDEIGIGKYSIVVKVQTWFKIVGLSNQFDQIDSSTIDFEIRKATGLKSLAKVSNLNVYPNPAKDELIIELNQFDPKASFEVFNILGSRLNVPYSLNGSANTAKLNTSELPNGVYFVKGKVNGSAFQTRFVKE